VILDTAPAPGVRADASPAPAAGAPMPMPAHALEQAQDNLAVVRMWWTVLEGEWRAAMSRAPGALVEPRVRRALEPFDDFQATVEELLARGDNVVASVRLRGRIGRCDVEDSEAWLCRLRDGAVTEVRDFPTLQQALAVADAG